MLSLLWAIPGWANWPIAGKLLIAVSIEARNKIRKRPMLNFELACVSNMKIRTVTDGDSEKITVSAYHSLAVVLLNLPRSCGGRFQNDRDFSR
jgi:hypothetical protein